MARKLQSDKWLFLATLALICASVVMVYSASALVALERFQQPYLFVTRQMMWAAVGVAVLSIVMRIDYRAYRNDKMIWIFVGVVTLMLVAVLFSRPINGTRRWFGIGGFGIQPGSGIGGVSGIGSFGTDMPAPFVSLPIWTQRRAIRTVPR